ncbi:MAG: NADH-quinone oxidoreductase subunit J [Chloroflexota bacterium]
MELALFLSVGAIAILGAVGVVTLRNAVHSALSLITNMVALAVLFLMLNAQFVAIVQIIVYAGAVMVLFLFVIMLLGEKAQEGQERRPGQRVFAVALGALLLAEIIYVAQFNLLPGLPGKATPEVVARSGNVQLVGRFLFSEYVFPFEVTSVLLLVAIVGAVVLAKRKL